MLLAKAIIVFSVLVALNFVWIQFLQIEKLLFLVSDINLLSKVAWFCDFTNHATLFNKLTLETKINFFLICLEIS